MLRVHEDSPYLDRDFGRFLDRLKHHCGNVVWLAIAEYDKDGRPHIHLLTQSSLDEETLRDNWLQPHGSADPNFFGSKMLPSFQDIRKHANYLSKDFSHAEHERVWKRRYRKSRHPIPQPMVFHGVTKADLDMLSQHIEQLTGSPVETWNSQQYWCPQIRTWTPSEASAADVLGLLRSYKPV